MIFLKVVLMILTKFFIESSFPNYTAYSTCLKKKIMVSSFSLYIYNSFEKVCAMYF
jgi:hypothetical protein